MASSSLFSEISIQIVTEGSEEHMEDNSRPFDILPVFLGLFRFREGLLLTAGISGDLQGLYCFSLWTETDLLKFLRQLFDGVALLLSFWPLYNFSGEFHKLISNFWNFHSQWFMPRKSQKFVGYGLLWNARFALRDPALKLQLSAWLHSYKI